MVFLGVHFFFGGFFGLRGAEVACFGLETGVGDTLGRRGFGLGAGVDTEGAVAPEEIDAGDGETSVTRTVSTGGVLNSLATENQPRKKSTSAAWTNATVLNIRLSLAGSSDPEPTLEIGGRPGEPPTMEISIKCFFSITIA